MKQVIQFCKASDGVTLAYSSVGSGLPMVKAANWMNHLELDWHSPVWKHVLAELARDHRLIRYDERGTGLSDRKVADLSFEAFVDDLSSVVEAAKLEKFALFGISQGGPVALAYASRYPERVSHVIILGSFGIGWKKAELSDKDLEKRKAQQILIRDGWNSRNPAIRQLWTTMCIPKGTAEEAKSFNELQLESVSAENAARIFESIGEFDVSGMLSSIEVPVIVFHSRGDALVPFDEGRNLASSIKNATFIPLDSDNHLILSHEPAWKVFVDEVGAFLGTSSRSRRGKVCPVCRASYADETLNFCLEDGAPLGNSTFDEPPTQIL
jgi:pimeloyl-ACP methyl ester carboxylesterase